MRQGPIVKITRVKTDGTKTVEVKRLGQESGVEFDAGVVDKVVAPSNITINMPKNMDRERDKSTVSKSPFQKPPTRIKSVPALIEERSKEFAERSPYITDAQIDEFVVPARLMTTKITEDGKPDTIVAECPLCHNRIETSNDGSGKLSCAICGLGAPGAVISEQLVIVEPIDQKLMSYADFGFDDQHPLKLVFKDD